MKRTLAAAVMALLVIPVSASADPAEDGDQAVGRILASNPATKRSRGVTERLNPCGTAHPRLGDFNGFDGYWIQLPADAAGRSATLTSDALDADVWFYTSEGGTTCRLIGEQDDAGWRAMASNLTGNEAGVVPQGADWAIVDVAAGNGVVFSFELD